MNVDILLRRLANELPKFSYSYRSEKDLQDGIARVLDGASIPYEREHIASKEDRFDFFVDGGVVIEAKVDGTFPAAARQIDRYLQLASVKGCAVVTTKRWEHRTMKTHLRGKPFVVVQVKRAAF